MSVDEEQSDAVDERLVHLFRLHVVELYRYVYRRVQDHGMAEEIVQDTFIRVLAQRDRGSPPTIAYLMTVARNRTIDEVRRRVTLQSKLPRLLEFGGTGDHAPEVSDRVAVEQALASLDAAHRIVLTLRYIDGLTVRELAKELGRTEKGVEALLHRARKALRHRLEAHHD